jgi:hypothetical protein
MWGTSFPVINSQVGDGAIGTRDRRDATMISSDPSAFDTGPSRSPMANRSSEHGLTSVVTLAAEIGRQHLGIVRDLPGFTGKPDPPGLEHIGIIRDLEGETCILLH